MRDLVGAVRHDHRQALDLMAKLQEDYDHRRLATARRTIDRLVALEARHEAAEARVLWPVVRDALREHATIRETAVAQENDARRLLHRLHKAPGAAAAEAMVPAVLRTLLAHIGLEDSQILPAVESAVGRNDLLRLGVEFRQAWEASPSRPHPRMPAIPGLLAVSAPLVRPIDRVRDLLRIR